MQAFKQTNKKHRIQNKRSIHIPFVISRKTRMVEDGFLSDDQRKVTSSVVFPSALLSIVGSSLIICSILREGTKRKDPTSVSCWVFPLRTFAIPSVWCSIRSCCRRTRVNAFGPRATITRVLWQLFSFSVARATTTIHAASIFTFCVLFDSTWQKSESHEKWNRGCTP